MTMMNLTVVFNGEVKHDLEIGYFEGNKVFDNSGKEIGTIKVVDHELVEEWNSFAE